MEYYDKIVCARSDLSQTPFFLTKITDQKYKILESFQRATFAQNFGHQIVENHGDQ